MSFRFSSVEGCRLTSRKLILFFKTFLASECFSFEYVKKQRVEDIQENWTLDIRGWEHQNSTLSTWPLMIIYLLTVSCNVCLQAGSHGTRAKIISCPEESANKASLRKFHSSYQALHRFALPYAASVFVRAATHDSLLAGSRNVNKLTSVFHASILLLIMPGFRHNIVDYRLVDPQLLWQYYDEIHCL